MATSQFQMKHTTDAFLQADLQRLLWEDSDGTCPEAETSACVYTSLGEFGGGLKWHAKDFEWSTQTDGGKKKDAKALLKHAQRATEKTSHEVFSDAWRIYEIWDQNIPFEFTINGHGDQIWKLKNFNLTVTNHYPSWRLYWEKEEMEKCEITEEYHPVNEMYYSDYGQGIWISAGIIDGLTSPNH